MVDDDGCWPKNGQNQKKNLKKHQIRIHFHLTNSGSSHDLKKLGQNSSYDQSANSSVLRDLKISLLHFFTDYPMKEITVRKKLLFLNHELSLFLTINFRTHCICACQETRHTNFIGCQAPTHMLDSTVSIMATTETLTVWKSMIQKNPAAITGTTIICARCQQQF